eukprot:1154307-Pelagomonas_calceolata.AAC.4
MPAMLPSSKSLSSKSQARGSVAVPCVLGGQKPSREASASLSLACQPGHESNLCTPTKGHVLVHWGGGCLPHTTQGKVKRWGLLYGLWSRRMCTMRWRAVQKWRGH